MNRPACVWHHWHATCIMWPVTVIRIVIVWYLLLAGSMCESHLGINCNYSVLCVFVLVSAGHKTQTQTQVLRGSNYLSLKSSCSAQQKQSPVFWVILFCPEFRTPLTWKNYIFSDPKETLKITEVLLQMFRFLALLRQIMTRTLLCVIVIVLQCSGTKLGALQRKKNSKNPRFLWKWVVQISLGIFFVENRPKIAQNQYRYFLVVCVLCITKSCCLLWFQCSVHVSNGLPRKTKFGWGWVGKVRWTA